MTFPITEVLGLLAQEQAIQSPPMRGDKTKTTIPNLVEITNMLRRLIKKEINCVSVGTVVSFNSATQTAEISINYERVINGVVVPYKTLSNVPVFIPSGGGTALTFPITAGDCCLLLFCDRSIDTWFTTGQTGLPPDSERTHDMSDAIAIVGLFPASKPLSGYDATNAKLGNGIASVILKGSKIKIQNSTLSLGFELASFFASKLLQAYAQISHNNAIALLCTALAADSNVSSGTRSAASAALLNTTASTVVYTAQVVVENTASSNIGMVIDGSGV